jgi:hypothetical protein
MTDRSNYSKNFRAQIHYGPAKMGHPMPAAPHRRAVPLYFWSLTAC